MRNLTALNAQQRQNKALEQSLSLLVHAARVVVLPRHDNSGVKGTKGHDCVAAVARHVPAGLLSAWRLIVELPIKIAIAVIAIGRAMSRCHVGDERGGQELLFLPAPAVSDQP